MFYRGPNEEGPAGELEEVPGVGGESVGALHNGGILIDKKKDNRELVEVICF